MNVQVTPALVTISDGSATLELSIVKSGWNTFGTLTAADGRTWQHNSVAAINLLILHAQRDFETVSELLEDLGPCDEALILAGKQGK